MATRTAKKSTTRKSTKAKATTAKKSTAKKATAKKSDVTFTEDIPKVTRAFGGNRTSKYDELLDALVERANADKKSTARMVFETVGQSTSRYQSIKGAIEKREDDAHMFEVAQRTEGEERVVYVKFDPEAEEPEEEDTDDEEVEDEEEEIEEDDDLEDEDEDDDLDF